MDAEALKQVRLEHDAARWRQLQKNPFAAVDALLAECNPSRPIEWSEQADQAIDRVASGYYTKGKRHGR